MVEMNSDLSRQARAVVKYLKISPRKVRLVINAVRRKPVPVAFSVLTGLKKKAARMVEQGLRSAVANAKVKKLDEGRLVVSEIRADGGPTMKRFMSRSMGRADQILKRSTHLTVIVSESGKDRGTFLPPQRTGEARGKKEKPGKTGSLASGKKKTRAAAGKA